MARDVLRSALEYAFAVTELGEEQAPPVPPLLIDHARLAASKSVPLQGLVGQYLAAYSVFKIILFEEQERNGHLVGITARQLLSSNDVVFERLIQTLSHEHERELQRRTRSRETRQLARVEQLLSGESIEAPDLLYDLDSTHIALVVAGPDSAFLIRNLARAFEVPPLIVQPSPGKAWGWIGFSNEIAIDDLISLLPSPWPAGSRIAIGEPGGGLIGWRRSHRQAAAAFAVAEQGERPVVRYSDVPLLASMAKDDLLKVSLREMYLVPLSTGRNGGKDLRRTLRSYFAAGRNGTSAAATLGISRQAVALRLQSAEETLGQSLTQCGDALHLALQLEELSYIRQTVNEGPSGRPPGLDKR